MKSVVLQIANVIIVLASIQILRKTNLIYDLTRHKGLQVFRYAIFLFMLSTLIPLLTIPLIKAVPLMIVHLSAAMLSTASLIFLSFSVQRTFKIEMLMHTAYIIGILTGFFVLITRIPETILLIQIPLILYILLSIPKTKGYLTFITPLLGLAIIINNYNIISTSLELYRGVIAVIVTLLYLIMTYKISRWDK